MENVLLPHIVQYQIIKYCFLDQSSSMKWRLSLGIVCKHFFNYLCGLFNSTQYHERGSNQGPINWVNYFEHLRSPSCMMRPGSVKSMDLKCYYNSIPLYYKLLSTPATNNNNNNNSNNINIKQNEELINQYYQSLSSITIISSDTFDESNLGNLNEVLRRATNLETFYYKYVHDEYDEYDDFLHQELKTDVLVAMTESNCPIKSFTSDYARFTNPSLFSKPADMVKFLTFLVSKINTLRYLDLYVSYPLQYSTLGPILMSTELQNTLTTLKIAIRGRDREDTTSIFNCLKMFVNLRKLGLKDSKFGEYRHLLTSSEVAIMIIDYLKVAKRLKSISLPVLDIHLVNIDIIGYITRLKRITSVSAQSKLFLSNHYPPRAYSFPHLSKFKLYSSGIRGEIHTISATKSSKLTKLNIMDCRRPFNMFPFIQQSTHLVHLKCFFVPSLLDALYECTKESVLQSITFRGSWDISCLEYTLRLPIDSLTTITFKSLPTGYLSYPVEFTPFKQIEKFEKYIKEIDDISPIPFKLSNCVLNQYNTGHELTFQKCYLI